MADVSRDSPRARCKRSREEGCPEPKQNNVAEERQKCCKVFRTRENRPEGLPTGKCGVRAPWPLHSAEALVVGAPDTGAVIVVDEAGKGSYAGPLVCAAVWGYDADVAVHDSKLLKPHERERLFDQLCGAAGDGDKKLVRYSVAFCEPAEIDELGMAEAWRKTMAKAASSLAAAIDDSSSSSPANRQGGKRRKVDPANSTAEQKRDSPLFFTVVVDGNNANLGDHLDPSCFATRAVVKADRTLWQGAAAGILAKVSRDRHMRELAQTVDDRFKDIFAVGAGYRWKPYHDELIRGGNFTKHHRKSFNPLRTFLNSKKRSNAHQGEEEDKKPQQTTTSSE